MPCEWKKIGGTEVLICSRGRKKPPKCVACDQPSVALCDFPVNGGTCDAPMCEDHRKPIARNVDYCPKHRADQGALFI